MRTKNYFLHLTFIFCLLSFVFAQATIRYVSHTGSSTPPYTTWETAADSIQKCINYSVNNDTIIVANGVYKETLFVNKAMWLLGSSMDSTVIDGRGLNGINMDFLTVEIGATVNMRNFTVIGRAPTYSVAIRANYFLLYLDNCKILDSGSGVQILDRSSVVKNSFIFNTEYAYSCGSLSDTTHPSIEGCLIINCSEVAAGIYFNDNPIIKDNIIIGDDGGYGTYLDFMVGTNTIINNTFSRFRWNIEGRYATDTTFITNNISSYGSSAGYRIDSRTDMRNNIAVQNGTGTEGPTNTNSDYNLYWNNTANTIGGLAEHDIVADPMFVKDTIPTYGGTYDYHLQMFSPAVDSGDPNILDVDGTRSDIGVYGGPGGKSYTYLDLPPRPPVNLNVNVDSLITLTWNRNSEGDTSYYKVYEDTVANFLIDSTKLVGSLADTFFTQTIPQNVESLYFKITAMDQQGNESLPSEEVGVLITSVNEHKPIVNDYLLYQNYPNPFNPSTKIGYKLKEHGYVKLMVYDITGALVSVLVNKVEEAGYHEVEFNSVETHQNASLSSGIYLYRIEVIGEGNIPKFSDMKKMILIK